jgi:hypothetical protein
MRHRVRYAADLEQLELLPEDEELNKQLGAHAELTDGRGGRGERKAGREEGKLKKRGGRRAAVRTRPRTADHERPAL